MARRGFLYVVVAFCFSSGIVEATTIGVLPTYGTAVIDGNYGEWNLASDASIPMYNAGDPGKPIEAYAYLRYDYTSSIMNVLVLQNGPAGTPYLLNSAFAVGNAWAYLGSNSNKVYNDGGTATYPPDASLPNLAWIPIAQPPDGSIHSVGYEASFYLAAPSDPLYDTDKFVVHVEWDKNPTGTASGGTAGSIGFAQNSADQIVLHLPPYDPDEVDGSLSQVPEPTSFLFLGTGLVGIGLATWRKKK